MKFAIDNITDELARMIIMIETGRRYFINNTIVENPAPMFVKQLDYCTINMYVRAANLIVLTPKGIDFNTCISLLIRCVNDKIHDLEAKIQCSDVIMRPYNIFACTREEYIRSVESLIMPKMSGHQIMKRAFILSDISDKNIGYAFRWDVRRGIMNSSDKIHEEANWLADKTNIYVNFIGAPLCRFTSHEQIGSVRDMLKHLGAKNIISYKTTQDGLFAKDDIKAQANKFRIVYSDSSADTIRVVSTNINARLGCFMHLRRADNRTTALQAITAIEFFDAFMEQKHELGAKFNLCQMCFKQYTETMYALGKMYTSDPRNDEFAAICKGCLCNDQIFADVSKLDTITIIKYETYTKFSEICESYGIPKQHAILYESNLIQKTHLGYVRNETSIAYNVSKVSIPLLTATVKFIDQDPNGEFIIFE